MSPPGIRPGRRPAPGQGEASESDGEREQSTAAQKIVPAGSLRQYFAEAVTGALEALRFQPNQETISYLVELLCEYAVASASTGDRPLALVMAEAQREAPARSIPGLKRVGDQSLYLTGYFSASLLRFNMDPHYYESLGSGAYRQLSHLLGRRRRQTRLVMVYQELGEEFTRFVQVLDEVRSQGEHAGGETLEELYSEWLRTGSASARRRLQAAGIFLLRRPGPRWD